MIPVTLLNFHIEADTDFDPGRVPGSSLRGAFYAALRIMYDTDDAVQSRKEKDKNPVGWLLRLEDSTLSGGKDVPRALAIRPFTDANDRTFGIALYGDAQQMAQMIISSVPTMGKLGVGPGRKKFRLISVSAIDSQTGEEQHLLGNTQHENTTSVNNQTMQLVKDNAKSLTVNFLTPTRIISQGHLSHQPIFRHWFQRLLERIRTISEVYTDTPVWIPFKELLAKADAVHLIKDQTNWVEGWSGSKRDGMVKPLGGFAGKAIYEGDFYDLIPYIRLGQALQVGKNTIKGCGWYTMTLS